jgi:uncharacterized protein (TIGR02271 family)
MIIPLSKDVNPMTDPALGGGAGVSGSSTTPTGGRALACLFATQSRAEEAREALIEAGLPAIGVTLTSQENSPTAGTASNEGGMWESLKRLFTGDDAVSYYEGINRGHTLLNVRAQSEDDADRIIEILDRFDPIDLDTQEAAWRQEGWTGRHDEAATLHAGSAGPAAEMAAAKPVAPVAATSEVAHAARTGEAEQVIPVYEESLKVGKREVGRGSVRIRAYTVETPVEEDVQLRTEHVRVERRPVDREATGGAADFQDRTVEMTESREEAVVQKTARVTEEVVITKDLSERTEHVSDTVRHTEVEVDESGRHDPSAPASAAAVPPVTRPDDVPPRR